MVKTSSEDWVKGSVILIETFKHAVFNKYVAKIRQNVSKKHLLCVKFCIFCYNMKLQSTTKKFSKRKVIQLIPQCLILYLEVLFCLNK